MILETNRLKILSLSFNELVDYVTAHKGFVKTDEDEMNVWEKTIIPMSKDKEENHLYYTFWIGFIDDKEVLQIGVLSPVNENGVVEIWVEVNEEYRGNGFGGEAMTALMEWLDKNENILFVGASIDRDNFASKKMVGKCGFEYGGEYKEVDIFYKRLKLINNG